MFSLELRQLEIKVLLLCLNYDSKLSLFPFCLLNQLFKLSDFFEVLYLLTRYLLVKQILLLLTSNLRHQVVWLQILLSMDSVVIQLNSTSNKWQSAS